MKYFNSKTLWSDTLLAVKRLLWFTTVMNFMMLQLLNQTEFLEPSSRVWFHLCCCHHATMLYQMLPPANIFISDFKASLVSQRFHQVFVVGVFGADRKKAGVQWTVQVNLFRCLWRPAACGGDFCVDLESILLTLSQINTDTESATQRNIKMKVWDYPQSLRALHVLLGQIELIVKWCLFVFYFFVVVIVVVVVFVFLTVTLLLRLTH